MSKYDRLRRSARVPGRRTNPWIHLAMLVVALVFLLSFRDRIAAGAAGCFGHLAEHQDASGEGAARGAAEETSPPVEPGASAVQVRFMPAREAAPPSGGAPDATAPGDVVEPAGDGALPAP